MCPHGRPVHRVLLNCHLNRAWPAALPQRVTLPFLEPCLVSVLLNLPVHGLDPGFAATPLCVFANVQGTPVWLGYLHHLSMPTSPNADDTRQSHWHRLGLLAPLIPLKLVPPMHAFAQPVDPVKTPCAYPDVYAR